MEPLYIETIKVLNGRVQNINYHNERCHRTRKTIYNTESKLNLRRHISVPDKFKVDLVKCRITYGKMVEKVEFEKYSAKEIKSLKLVEGKRIKYYHKSVDRAHLHSLYEKKGEADDIIIVRDGLLTDTYYGNIALLKNGKWYTPTEPLLQGTMRSKLLAKGHILKKIIKVEDISTYECITVFNAMIPFKSILLSTEYISQ